MPSTDCVAVTNLEVIDPTMVAPTVTVTPTTRSHNGEIQPVLAASWAWPGGSNIYVLGLQFQYQRMVTGTPTGPVYPTEALIGSLALDMALSVLPGQDYQWRVRAAGAGVFGSWGGWTTVTATNSSQSQATDVANSIVGQGPLATAPSVTAPLIAAYVLPGDFQRLKIDVTSTTQATVTADSIVALNGGGFAQQIASLSATVDLTVTGINGKDGALGTSTWVYLFAVTGVGIADGVMVSATSTAPSYPTGYSFSRRIGSLRLDGSGNLFKTRQRGKVGQYINSSGLPLIVTGIAGSVVSDPPTWAAQSVVGTFVPPLAAQITVNVYASGTSIAAVSPNNTYGGYNNGSNNKPYAACSGNTTTPVTMILESSSIYWATNNGASQLFCGGWVDDI